MEARQGKLEISRFRIRQRKPASSGRSLSNQTQRAKSRSKHAAEATHNRSICRSYDAARGLSQGRRSRKILLRSAGLLQTIHSTSTIAAAKVLFAQLSQRFTHRLAARTTLVPEARDRTQTTTRRPFENHPKVAFRVTPIDSSPRPLTLTNLQPLIASDQSLRSGFQKREKPSAMPIPPPLPLEAALTSAGQQDRLLALETLDERLRRYRLVQPKLEKQMMQSLRDYGQVAPIIVCPLDGQTVLVDGFKRLHAARSLKGFTHLSARLLEVDEQAAKVALFNLNRIIGRPVELEEAWIIDALVRDDGLQQVEVDTNPRTASDPVAARQPESSYGDSHQCGANLAGTLRRRRSALGQQHDRADQLRAFKTP